ncbi:uncharacterized protein N7484_004975 [Penicillium longicatenatum]|uniref:uncharacterized protein n=1 Tax=Penicillium longicatenatum TaxID=1561947 RepID=UPI0025494B67|nr:uncharacterized protein N7484_004975 [Penicillium longicatenatum]KAJ5651252.1 hypothetical protein N7484_004975 [Penicillium longicatenatum]
MTDRFRRNGQPSSCEPCRRSKLRCDHARPHCTRCVRRNISRKCYYHPSPMTQGAESYAVTLLTPQSTRPNDTAATSSAFTPFTPSENSSAENYDYGRGTGLVNMHNSLMPLADLNGRQPLRQFAYLTRTGIFTPMQAYPLTPASILEGVEVLRSLLEFYADLNGHAQRLYENEAVDLCGSIILNAAWRATHTTLQCLGSRPSVAELASTATAIFEQTASPFKLPSSAANGAIELALSGPRLRWETIGLCFTQIGPFIATMRSNSQACFARGQSNFDRHKAMIMAFDACMKCRAFCDQVEQTNDLTLWLLVSVSALASWCFGDDSSRAWCLVGDLSSAIAALGFHKGFESEKTTPPYLVELRKRVMALAHQRDKELATFVGRPPRLSRLYYTMDLPLDLPDKIIIGSVEQFESAKATLDQNGWSRNIMVNPVSRLRAVVLLSMIREEVLELSLGPQIPSIAQQAREILSKLTSTWESIPHVEYEQSMCESMLPSAIWVILGPRLDYLYTKFLLHKLLITHNEGNREKMIHTSHDILHLALSLMKKHDLIATPNLEWLMVFYAMPCASMLILELFRQNRQSQRTMALNRSTLIQDISVLISCCDSLAISGQSNYQICKQAQAVFSRCLDQILNPVELLSHGFTSQAERQEAREPFSLGPMDLGLTELYPQNLEWSAWLESFDLYGG